MIAEVRNSLWCKVRAKLPRGLRLPWWAMALRAVLYPLDYLYYRLSTTRGLQWDTGCWRIEGIDYDYEFFAIMKRSNGEVFRVQRTGDRVTLERLTQPQAKQFLDSRIRGNPPD